LDCIDFEGRTLPHSEPEDAPSNRLVTCPYFHLEKVRMPAGTTRPLTSGRPVVWMMLSGSVRLSVTGGAEPLVVKTGETVLFPAKLDQPKVEAASDTTWLEVTFPS